MSRVKKSQDSIDCEASRLSTEFSAKAEYSIKECSKNTHLGD